MLLVEQYQFIVTVFTTFIMQYHIPMFMLFALLTLNPWVVLCEHCKSNVRLIHHILLCCNIAVRFNNKVS